MFRKVIFVCLLLYGFSGASGASLLDFFWEPNLDSSLIEKREDDIQKSSCECDGPTCNCCVDFNITYIDLGGPGCVEMKYLSQNEGITVNISYGDSQLHAEQVKGPNPPPTCMSLLANIAEICARFSILEPHDNGLRGCVLLEPKLLMDTQTQFDIGCFLMGNDGMKIDPNANSTLNMILDNVNQIRDDSQNQTDTGGFSEELIAVVNESAEKGLLFFGNLLGIAFGQSDLEEKNTQESNITSETH